MSKLRVLRLRRCLTQRQLAAAIGIDPSNLCTIETLKRKPCKPEQGKLSAFFGCPWEQLEGVYDFSQDTAA
jgi:transcriptional regulator with XRE-family HTH domain